MRYILENRSEGQGERVVLALPDWSDFDLKRQLQDLEALLLEGERLAEIQAQSRAISEPLFLPWEQLHDRIHKAWGPIAHLYNVNQEAYPEIQKVFEAGERILSDFATRIGQHEGLYRAYLSFRYGDAYAALDAEGRRVVDEGIKDFELSGVLLSQQKKTRIREINTRLSDLSTRYAQNIQDSQNAWSLHLTDDSRLIGVPDAAKEAMRASAHREGKEGYLVTVHQPIYIALIERAEDRELRKTIYEAYHTRASDQGPLAGKFDNAPLMREIVSLRHESAVLLGFPSYNAFRLAKRMAPSTGDVSSFLAELSARVVPRAKKEFAELVAFARNELEISEVLPWDVAYIARAMKERRFGVDQEALREYFTEDRVFETLFSVLGRVYGIEFRERRDIPVFADGVRFFEVWQDGRMLGGVYADLYARRGKRPGAWMDNATDRMINEGIIQLPVAYFNCNFLPQTGGKAALRHDDIETVFHEFGHVLHHVLCATKYPSTGMGSVEWDAVEFPSQMTENWCWRPEVLRDMGVHRGTGEPIPDSLVERLVSSRLFHSGMFLARQLALGLFDWELHLRAAESFDPQAMWDDIQKRLMPMPFPAWSRYPNAFSHIFDGGYAAGYYSYLWAETLAADAFEDFQKGDVFNREIGKRFQREILAPGGSRPMMESFRAFRGREPDPGALLRAYGIEASE